MDFVQEKRLRVLQQVITKAWDDSTFRQELIKSPIEAIERLTGEKINLPEGVNRIEVLDQTDTKYLHLNIPPKPNMDDMELTESDLEVVAGGGYPTAVFRPICRLPIHPNPPKLPGSGPIINKPTSVS